MLQMEHNETTYSTCSTWDYQGLLILLLECINPIIIFVGTIAFITNIVFLGCVFSGVHKRALSIKRFIFVANRSIADIITCTVVIAYVNYSQFKDCENVHLGCTTSQPWGDGNPLPLQVVITMDYWAVAGSYSGIAILTWYAVKSPLGYRISLTGNTVVRIVLLGWLIMATLLFGIMMLTDEDTNFNSNGMIYVILHKLRKVDPSRATDELNLWLFDLCDNLHKTSTEQSGTIALVMPVLTYLIAFLSYLLVSCLLYRRREETRISKRHFACVWRLGIHLGLFTLTCCLMSLAYYATSPIKHSCAEFDVIMTTVMAGGDVPTSWCFVAPLFRYCLLSSLASFGWFTRMCIDPIIDMMIDGGLRKFMFPSRKSNHKASTYTLNTFSVNNEAQKISQMTKLNSDFETTAL